MEQQSEEEHSEMENLDPDEQVHGQEKPTTVSFELYHPKLV